MFQNFWTLLRKRCSKISHRIILVPLATLGILGFLINTHTSFISSDYNVCYPKSNVVFLKIHKCAGSSIQNILLRYGDTHQLNFVLPSTGNYLGHPAPFSRTMVPPPRSFSFNILAHHTRLDHTEIKAVMPPNSAYITIIRDPVQIFESSFSYYGLDKFYGGSLNSFIEDRPTQGKEFANRRYKGKFGTNQMLFDLGADPTIFDNDTLVTKYLDKLDAWFDLILVADRMDESLVLLRHLMCWDLDDVVTFKLNARSPKFKSNLTEKEKGVLRQLNHADVLLYERFLARFEKEIEAFGRERMEVETEELRARTRKWFEFCVEEQQLLSTPRVTPKYYYNPRVMVFEQKSNVTNSTCKAMTMEELPYTDILRKRQLMRLPMSIKSAVVRNKTVISKRRSRLRRVRKL